MKKAFLFILIFLLFESLSFAGSSVENLSFLPKYPAKISPGVTITDARTLFYIDNLIPLLGYEHGLFFVNPKVVLGSNDANEQNVGCGYRQLLFNDNLLLGANFYYDTNRSKNNRRYHQLGFGAEAFITEWLDLRSNFYFPLSEKERLREGTSYSFGERGLIAKQQLTTKSPCGALIMRRGSFFRLYLI